MTLMRVFGVGDRVRKNPEAWVPNEFDSWGRGEGFGVVVESPVPVVDRGAVNVQWPHGRCWEDVKGLLLDQWS